MYDLDDRGECSGCGGAGCPSCLGGSIMGRDAPFREPGGRSALRAGKRRHACPTCGESDALTDADKRRGYQCDACADSLEGFGP